MCLVQYHTYMRKLGKDTEMESNLPMITSKSFFNVMVNLMCQLGWAVVSRYLINYYPGCFCEGIYIHILNFAFYTGV